MIAELAEPRISPNVPRPFTPLGVGYEDEKTMGAVLRSKPSPWVMVRVWRSLAFEDLRDV